MLGATDKFDDSPIDKGGSAHQGKMGGSRVKADDQDKLESPKPAAGGAPQISVAAAMVDKQSSDALKTAFENQSAAVQACYDKAVAAHAGLKGQLDLTFKVGADGKLTSAAAAKSSTVKDPSLVSCVIDIVNSLQLADTKKAGAGALHLKLRS